MERAILGAAEDARVKARGSGKSRSCISVNAYISLAHPSSTLWPGAAGLSGGVVPKSPSERATLALRLEGGCLR